MKRMKTYESYNSNRIRVSCAGLASIKIDDKYLLIRNKGSLKRGWTVYGPLGGALEFHPEALDFLNTLNPKFERETPDLRLVIDENKLDQFTEWFYEVKDREKSCVREVIEELVDEEKILDDLSEGQISETYIKTVTDKRARFGVTSQRYFDIYEIDFDDSVKEKIKYLADNDKDSPIKLLTPEQILDSNELVKDGFGVGFHSRFVIV